MERKIEHYVSIEKTLEKLYNLNFLVRIQDLLLAVFVKLNIANSN